MSARLSLNTPLHLHLPSSASPLSIYILLIPSSISTDIDYTIPFLMKTEVDQMYIIMAFINVLLFHYIYRMACVHLLCWKCWGHFKLHVIANLNREPHILGIIHCGFNDISMEGQTSHCEQRHFLTISVICGQTGWRMCPYCLCDSKWIVLDEVSVSCEIVLGCHAVKVAYI